jgi:glycosyltransferase involved in cell wall biosynthesis
MNILQIHNYYQYSGGEDVVLKNEYELLTSKKHTVLQYLKNNSEISDYSLLQKGKLFYNTSYSKKSYREILKLFKVEKPDVAHVHNTLPLITPAVYYACNELNIPVVQTLHNYRLLCSNDYLFRNGKVCEECIGKSLYHSLKYGCYRYSRIQTFALARMVEKHRKLVTWSTKIDAYIALTNFSKKKSLKAASLKIKFL